jgi:hypothetical protein
VGEVREVGEVGKWGKKRVSYSPYASTPPTLFFHKALIFNLCLKAIKIPYCLSTIAEF